ncbi:Alanine--tRNA ligase [Mycoemilia scoparia]|uniref:Alanine--tRNA ligase n=1 Tax=Mycoemilia scoparia TaxID=417184 RepID=A0A9W8DX06_9FUNG|nr:Alanine--tRNA ligase [Mycoemilia scoparia]
MSETLKWPVDEVRSTFFNFFKGKDHEFTPSSSTIPHDDPTLLFANAGMNQFKPIIQGTVDPGSKFATLSRAYNTQKCIRAGGKHNDLDDVGKDVYHHTFFEMLGNWSFGDYFKKHAVEYSWELLTKVYGLDPERLYVTYFGGDESQGLPADEEARQLWRDIGLPDKRILPFDCKDNFWEMGDVGPCGPCSEIHFDRIGNRDAAHLVNMDDPDVLEIWNLVFMQYNREVGGNLRPLPKKHIDTGMGLERLVSVLQDKRSNYDTDVFQPIFEVIQKKTNAPAYTGKVGADDVTGIDTAYRVIADHVRTLTFAISDGGVPSNEGRGYVLRRILRRGARFARKRFNAELGSFFPDLVDVVVEKMGGAYPEIAKRVDDVKAILNEEEVSFARTLDRGEKLFDKVLNEVRKTESKVLPGRDVWRLYDTYGFPVDLTRLMAEELGFKVDEAEFESERQKSIELSKQKRGGKGAENRVTLDVHAIANLSDNMNVPKTDDSFKYHSDAIEATVLAIYNGKEFVKSVDASLETNPDDAPTFGVLLDKTNFYAESGGQEYDTGVIIIDDGSEFAVEDVQVYGGYVLHTGFLKSGKVETESKVECQYNELRRRPIRHNHTATHLLNYALRSVLVDDSPDQRGSLVAEDRLRFDFSYKHAITPDQLNEIEKITNDLIKQNLQAYTKEVSLDEALKIPGLRAVFGEVYPDPVRVVSIGADIDEIMKSLSDSKWANYSIEFCGGTHVPKTGEIKLFSILEEGSIAKGIRRIIAVTGEEAMKSQLLAKSFEEEISRLEELKGAELEAMLKKTSVELNNLTISAYEKHLFRQRFDAIKAKFVEADKAAKAAIAKAAVDKVKELIENNPDTKFIIEDLNVGGNNKAISSAITHIKSLKGSDAKAALFVSVDKENGRVAYQCIVPKSFVEQGLEANKWASGVSEILGGKSGGKKESAQGSGVNVDKVDEALKFAQDFAKLKISSA